MLFDLSRAPHGGRARLLPENRTASRIVPRLLILHSIVGSAESAYQYFLRSSNLESTFVVTSRGEIWQLMDTTRQADANYHANPFAISVETEDGGAPDRQPWTAAQLDAITWLAWEANRIHGVPLRRADRWDGAGIGWHTQFGAPGPWTPVRKTCPGRARIAQIPDLLTRIQHGQHHVPAENDMPYTEDQLIRFAAEGARRALNEATVFGQRSGAGTIKSIHAGVGDLQAEGRAQTAAILAALRAVPAPVDPKAVAATVVEHLRAAGHDTPEPGEVADALAADPGQGARARVPQPS